MYQFRDPVHGFIDVSEDELKIINSAPFQRLRNIHQLATTYLVYHGAEHTRFGHSIGVMHLTSRVFEYDLDRFVSTLTAYKHNNQLQLAIERGGVQALEEFVLARYFMFIQVYFHKTRRYLDKVLVKSLKTVLPNGKYPDTTSEYLKWDDTRILNLIAESENDDVMAFKKRKIMTCVLESKAHSGTADKINARMIFNILKKEYSDRVVFDSVDKTAHKLTPMLLSHKDDSGKGIMILDEKTGEVKDIMEESIILESIVKPISINRIYAEKEIADEVLTRIKELQSA